MTMAISGIMVKTEPPVLDIRIPKPDIKVNIDKGDYALDIKYPKVQLDSTECWDDIGYKSSISFSRDMANKGNMETLEGIKRTAVEGDRLASDLRPEGQAIIDMLKDRWFEEKELNVAAVPKERVDVQVSPGRVAGRYKPYNMNVDVPRSVVSIKYVKGSVKVEYVGNDRGRF